MMCVRLFVPFIVIYLRLYHVSDSSHDELLSKVSMSLSSDQCASCEGLLSRRECWRALKGMAHGKARTCDGLPMEFYVKF